MEDLNVYTRAMVVVAREYRFAVEEVQESLRQLNSRRNVFLSALLLKDLNSRVIHAAGYEARHTLSVRKLETELQQRQGELGAVKRRLRAKYRERWEPWLRSLAPLIDLPDMTPI
jgi:hypothetical protein